MSTLLYTPELGQKIANTIRFLAADAVQKANSGHPGMPMGMADCATVLWTHFLQFNPQKPDWLNRDRFILSAGHGSMLLYALLYLSGFDVRMEDLQSFRQWESRTPGHPEHNCLPGVETTTGPLGQGFANGVGMAIAARMLAEKYNREGFPVLGTHKVFAIVSDGDLMEGISHEAASIAGHLKLGNIIYIYDDNHITIEGNTELTFSEDVQKRFEAYGWQTIKVDGHNHQQVLEALQAATRETEHPSLIIARTHIGYGSPHKQDTAEVHGSPLGEEELRAAKRNLGWPEEPAFYVPKEVQEFFQQIVRRNLEAYQQWEEAFEKWQQAYPELSDRLMRDLRKEIPEDLQQTLLTQMDGSQPKATRVLSGEALQIIAENVPNLVGGAADLAPSTNTLLKKYSSIAPGKFQGRNFHFGIREHGMGGILNGMALYGGFIPFGATFLVFSDYMRPTIRLAAMMGIQVIYVFTHDSIFIGEDGPTHQPVEHLAALRAIPNLVVFRPADALEVAMGWWFALQRKNGPTALILTRQKVNPVPRPEKFDASVILKGGYVISPEKGRDAPNIVLVATGSEVPLAIESQSLLEKEGIRARVVSIPSQEIFLQQPEEYRQAILGADSIPLVVIEAATSRSWFETLRRDYRMIGLDRFGASAPYKVLAEKFGFTPESVAARVKKWLGGT